MDRLADISRPAPSNRHESTDATRTQSKRPERRDDIEVRPEDRVKDRDRASRSEEKNKPERFADQLEEKKATLAKPAPAAAQPENATEPQSEAIKAQAGPKAEETRAQNALPATESNDQGVQPVLKRPQLDLPVAAPSVTPKDAPKAPNLALPIAPLPTLDPTPLPTEFAAAVAPKVTDATPAPAKVTRIDIESAAGDGDSSVAKLGAARAETSSAQTSAAAPKLEAPAETPKTQATHAPAAARAAQDVEQAADILRQLRVQITPQLQEAHIQLHPLELGRVSIHLAIEDGRVRTTVRAERRETLNAIQTQLPELRASLRQHGIEAQDFQLALGFENNGRGSDGDAPTPRRNATGTADEAVITQHNQRLRTALAKTGVDIYA